MSAPGPKPTSLRAYARRRRVSAEAVSKAITAGRLRESVVMVGGAPKIADVEVADREWEANTRPRVDMPTAPRRAPVAALDEGGEDELPAGVPSYNVSRAVREFHAARRESALADVAEIDATERRGELVSVVDARDEMVNMITIAKTKLLGVPSRVAQRLPELAAVVTPVVDALIREALEELAGPTEGPDVAGAAG